MVVKFDLTLNGGKFNRSSKKFQTYHCFNIRLDRIKQSQAKRFAWPLPHAYVLPMSTMIF